MKLKLKIDLFLFFFQNSTVYDLSNCCVIFAPHCIFVVTLSRHVTLSRVFLAIFNKTRDVNKMNVGS
jgi:hypothetical protein